MAARTINDTLAAALLAVMCAAATLAPVGHSSRIIAPAPLGEEEIAPYAIWGQQKSRQSLSECQSSFASVNKCMEAAFTSLLKFQIPSFGGRCCHAMEHIDEAYWPESFPVNPFNPPMLRSYCTQMGTAPSASVSH